MKLETMLKRMVSRAVSGQLGKLKSGKKFEADDIAHDVMKLLMSYRFGDIGRLVDRYVAESVFEDIGDWGLEELLLVLAEGDFGVFSVRPVVLRGVYKRCIGYEDLGELLVQKRKEYRAFLEDKVRLSEIDGWQAEGVSVEVGGVGMVRPRELRTHVLSWESVSSSCWYFDSKVKGAVDNQGDDHISLKVEVVEGSVHVKVYQDGHWLMTFVGHADGLGLRLAPGLSEIPLVLHGLSGSWLVWERCHE